MVYLGPNGTISDFGEQATRGEECRVFLKIADHPDINDSQFALLQHSGPIVNVGAHQVLQACIFFGVLA